MAYIITHQSSLTTADLCGRDVIALPAARAQLSQCGARDNDVTNHPLQSPHCSPVPLHQPPPPRLTACFHTMTHGIYQSVNHF